MKLLAIAMMFCLSAAADVQRVFQLKHVKAKDIQSLFVHFAQVSVDSSTNSLAVNGSESAVKTIEEAIGRLDVPKPKAAPLKGIEMTFHVVRAGTGPAKPLGKELEGVSRQLSQVFGYTKLEVLDTIPMRGTEGDWMESEGLLQLGTTEPAGPATYRLQVRGGDNKEPESAGMWVRVDFVMKLPVGANFRDAKITTTLTLREGQKVVVGKTNSGMQDGAIFLVVSAKLVE